MAEAYEGPDVTVELTVTCEQCGIIDHDSSWDVVDVVLLHRSWHTKADA